MARDTLASLRADLETVKSQLSAARSRDYGTAPLGEVSTALLERLDAMKCDQQEDISKAESELERIERAYEEADSADDRVRELDL